MIAVMFPGGMPPRAGRSAGCSRLQASTGTGGTNMTMRGIAGPTALLWLLAATAARAEAPAKAPHEHAAHEHGAPAATTLQLDGGKKWKTDETLRSGMAALRDELGAALPAIHAGTMQPAAYADLAGKLEKRIHGVVAACKLSPQADVQLHIVLGELLGGIETLRSGKDRHAGAIRFLKGLDLYAAYFDHPGWDAPTR